MSTQISYRKRGRGGTLFTHAGALFTLPPHLKSISHAKVYFTLMLVLAASTSGMYSCAMFYTHLAECIHTDAIASEIRVNTRVHSQ